MVATRLVSGRGYRGLHYDYVGPGFHRSGRHPLGVLGGKSNRAGGTCAFDLLNPLPDQVVLDRFGVNLLKVLSHFRLGHGRYFFQDRIRVFIAGVQSLSVEHPQAAQLVHQGGEPGRDGAVHCGSHHGSFKAAFPDGHCGRCHLRIYRYVAGNNSYFVEAVRPFQFLEQAS